MGRWDYRGAEDPRENKGLDKLTTHSIALSIGTLFGMALVYFFG